MEKLTINNFIGAAIRLNCEEATLRAVHAVEASGDGFFPSGKIKIRFEAHWFSHYTNGIYDKSYPNISVKEANRKLCLQGEKEYLRFNIAFALNPTAAMLATSWGAFQIMGFNFSACQYESVDWMVTDFKKGEYNQLLGFCEFIKSKSLDDELREHRWADFAYYYNGKGYKKNQYDTKLANAYHKFKTA